MEVIATDLPEVKIIVPKRVGDSRGFFSETYRRDALSNAGIDCDFLQDNHSLSEKKGTLRGLHFQTPPHSQAKLVRVVRGAVFDAVVDIRHGSPNFGKSIAAVLSAENGRQMFVPAGFAHAFLTLEPATEVIYKVDDYYAPDCEGGIIWNDPQIGIEWPIEQPILSAKDAQLGRLAELSVVFAYDDSGR